MLKSVKVLALIVILFIFGCQEIPTSVYQNSSEDFLKNNLNLLEAKPSCIDVEGNIYTVVKIGSQWWMAENLRVTCFQNEEIITEIISANDWKITTEAAYCYYENNHNTAQEYGLLYNWRAITDSRDIAPSGWHVPSDADWQILENYLGGRGRAGEKLKETGNAHWDAPNWASNASGFTALPGGQRDYRGNFTCKRGYGFYWSTSVDGNSRVWIRFMDHMFPELERSDWPKRSGLSVRCVLGQNQNLAIQID